MIDKPPKLSNPLSISAINIIEQGPSKPSHRLSAFLTREMVAWTTLIFEIIPAAKPVWTDKAVGRWATEQNGVVPGKGSETRSFVSRRYVTPSALRRAQILAKRDAAIAQAGQQLIGTVSPKPVTSPADSFQGLHSVTVTRIAEAAALDKENVVPNKEKAPTQIKDKHQKISSCLECGKRFTRMVDGVEKTLSSQFDFCGETDRTTGTCKQVWLEKHPPASLSRREHSITFDAHVAGATYRRAISKGIASVIAVKAKKYWCVDCVEYRAKDHECKPQQLSSPRALSVNLRNVWKPIRQQWEELRELRHNPPARKPERELKGVFTMSDLEHQVIVEERAKLIVKNYVPHVPGTPKAIDYLKEVGTGEGRPFVNDWKFAPPPPFSLDHVYLAWAEKTCPQTPVQTWWAEQSYLQLQRHKLTLWAGSENLSYQGTVRKLARISDARQITELNGGRRVNTTSRFTADDSEADWDSKSDRNSRDLRADATFNAQQDSKAERTPLICKYTKCRASFVTKRKGQKYCSKNCCNRNSEEPNTKGDN